MEILSALAVFKKELDSELFDYLFKIKKELKIIDPKIIPVFEQLEKIAKGGKRLRAYLCYLGYLGFGGKDRKKILKVGVGLELLHLFALIHDDIMDEATRRRGVATINALFGNSVAILAGDLAFSLAEEIFSKVRPCVAARSDLVQDYWQKLKKEVIVGQYLDLIYDSRHAELVSASLNNQILKQVQDDVEEKDLLRIMELKSARYTVLRPLGIGAALAGASKNEIEKLQDYAVSVGIAFQLRDDILDFGKFQEISLVSLKGKGYCQKLAYQLVLKAKKILESVTIRNHEKRLLSELAGFMISWEK